MPNSSPDSTPPLSDEELMLRAGTGDQQAFSELVRRHQRPLVNFFCRMGVGRSAEDLAQETFIRLYRYRERYKATAKFTTFLYTVARHVRIDALRKKKRTEELHQAIRRETETPRPLVDSSEERKARAVEALASLSAEAREVVVLNIYQGLTYDEIAAALEIPTGTVKSRMFYAVRKMRKTLDVTDR